jgi:tetratricopeptide (TPR) repeat protein
MKGIEVDPSVSGNYHGVGYIYREQGKYEEALQWFRKGIEVDPSNSYNYHGIGWVYADQNNYNEALKWFKEAIKRSPNDRSIYDGISLFYQKQDRYDEIADFFNDLKKDNPDLVNCVKIFQKKDNIDKEITNWIANDIEEVIKICIEKEIKIILQSYPIRQRASFVLEQIAGKHSLPFVDNYSILQKMILANGDNMSDYFVLDGHCNSRGYGIIVENIYDKMKETKLIDF